MGARHWVDQRSAKELARAFCGSGKVSVPDELQALLDSHPSLGHVEVAEAWAEHKIPLDSSGETRNADLACLASGRPGIVAVTVEAKADESFDKLVSMVLTKSPKGSNIPNRIEMLRIGLFGLSVDVSSVRYQLLHGVAASLIFAAEHGAAAAIFAVFELRSDSCSTKNVDRNTSDLEKFVALFGGLAPLQAGRLFGPFTVPGHGKIPSELPSSWGRQFASSKWVLSNNRVAPEGRRHDS